MAAAKQYSLDDFTKHARKLYSAQFKIITNASTYEFAAISYMNGDHEGRQADMLRIGHYWQRNGGPPVWGYTNGHDRIHNASGTDMLANLKFTCLKLERNQKTEDMARHAQLEKSRAIEAQCSGQAEHNVPDMVPHVAEVHSEPLQKNNESQENLLRYEADIDSDLTQQRQVHHKELANLQAKFTAQETKTEITMTKLAKEKRKRGAVEDEAQSWKQKSVAQEQRYERIVQKYAKLKDKYASRKEKVRVMKEVKSEIS
ncbi:hypothetical protein EK21DRAFT_91316 [Setomelanomma holmii]|uniref:Uncharacterized protein n=1 Tax=Setomelanomma holmii TaxID=210430 RepID=A0A9P4H5V7_9PLEO|nr:hypothetical protein EK21DRAFT_91316 [Setomelanomma holmii]